MKINNFRGDLTDDSAKKEALPIIPYRNLLNAHTAANSILYR